MPLIIDLTSDPIVQGEGRWLKFTYTDFNGDPLPMPETGYTFVVKNSIGATGILYTATNFDVTDRDIGIILVNLPASETDNFPTGNLYGEMTAIIISETDVDIQQIKFKVKPKV